MPRHERTLEAIHRTCQVNQRASATAGDTRHIMHFTLGDAARKGKTAHARSPCHPRPHAPRRWSRVLKACIVSLRRGRVFGAHARGGCPSRTRRVPCIATCERSTVAYGSFEQALIALEQSVAELRAGAFGWGRHDGRHLASGTQSIREGQKEQCGLAATMRHMPGTVLSPARWLWRRRLATRKKIERRPPAPQDLRLR